MTVIHNTTNHQFEIHFSDAKALLQYRIRDGIMYFMHTEVPDGKEGQGVASRLAEFSLNYAKKNNHTIVVYCPFVKAYLKKHHEYVALIEESKQDKSQFLT